MALPEAVRGAVASGSAADIVAAAEAFEIDSFGAPVAEPVRIQLLLVTLLSLYELDELALARLALQRSSSSLREKNPELAAVAELGDALWDRNFKAFYERAARYSWGPTARSLLDRAIAALRARRRAAIAKAYSSISVARVAEELGVPAADVPGVVREYGWAVEGGFVLPTKESSDRSAASKERAVVASIDEISRFIVHLESGSVADDAVRASLSVSTVDVGPTPAAVGGASAGGGGAGRGRGR